MKLTRMDKQLLKKTDLTELLGAGLFAVCVAAFLYVATVAGPVLTESDASSDMLQAWGSPVWSRDWYFANGVNMFNLQWLRWLLLRFIDQWSTVRAILFVVTVGAMLPCIYYTLRQMGLGGREFYFSASFMLVFFMRLPNEKQQYTTILMYGILSFGLLLRALRLWSEKSEKKDRGGRAALALFLLLAFLSGVCADHLRLTLYVPFALAGGLLLLLRAKDAPAENWKEAMLRLDWAPLLVSTAAIVCATLGIYAARYVLWPMLGLNVQPGVLVTRMSFVMPDGNTFSDVIMAYFRLFGYVDGVGVSSYTGLGSCSALALGVFCAVLTVVKGIRAAKEEGARARELLLLCCVCAALFITAAVPMLFTTITRFDRYYLPLFSCFALVLGVFVSKCSPASPRRALFTLGVSALIGVDLLAGFVYTRAQYRYTDFSADREVLSYLETNGYTKGFAPYWYASVNTERTNGKVEIAPVNILREEQGEDAGKPYIQTFRWLTPCHAYDMQTMGENGKLFLLLPGSGAHPEDRLEPNFALLKTALKEGEESLPTLEKVYENEAYTVYELSEGAYFDELNILKDA